MVRQVVEVSVVEMREPTDVSGLRQLLAEEVDARDIVAVIGKTEGTGLGKDNGREAADQAIKKTLAASLQLSTKEVAERICIILSGGCPGVITPHIALVSRRLATEEAVGHAHQRNKRLVVGVAHSAPIEANEVGRSGQIDKVAAAVTRALADANVDDPTDVHAVLVKAPALTEASIAAATERGLTTVTRDLGIGPEGAICFANDGSALGVAVALGEVARDQVSDDRVRTDFSLYSEVAFASSGGEKTRAEVVVLANSERGGGALRIGHSAMRSILDLEAPSRAVRGAVGAEDGSHEVAYVLAKMIIPGAADLCGRRTTLHDDPLGYHVAKGMGGYLVALTTGTTAAFVSGGERNSHQGPPDGNPLAVIVRLRGDALDEGHQ